MSLRWRILGSFIFVVLLTALLTIGVSYWNTQRQLAEFTAEIGSEEAEFLAQFLSQEYTFTNGWNNVEQILFDTGYYFDEALIVDEFQISSDEIATFFIEPPSRVVVLDITDHVIVDSAKVLEVGTQLTDSESLGESDLVYDLRTREQVGTVFVEINPDFLVDESANFLADTLFTTLIGGLITAIIVSLLAAWFAQRITAPVTALTEATLALAEQGQAELLPVTSTDELGQMSQAFNRMTTSLQTQRGLRKRLIDDVSHELNTPLSVIQLEAKGLHDGLQEPREAAEHIIQEVEMLRNLVHDLNWLAETDSGELRLNLEPCTLSDLLAAEGSRWQTQAQAQQIQLTLQTMPNMPDVQLDKMRISQVLGNLLRNALQHTDPHGNISIAATFGSTAGSNSNCAVITIADDGVGIDPAVLPHIFDRFYRADQSRNRFTGGRGLGLAITQAIVEAHHGSIMISSDGIGQGTTARIELPL
ncbi:MAG: sensor histidine kinase [Anaerolineae bacterium]